MEKILHAQFTGRINLHRQRIKFLCRLLAVMVIGIGTIYAQPQPDKKISVRFSNEKLAVALKTVADMTGYKINFSLEDVMPYTVTQNVENATIRQALDQILSNLPFTTRISSEFITVTKTDGVESAPDRRQTATVSGKITDNKNRPLAGASVVIEGTPYGTSSDANGNYRLSFVPSGSDVIVISCIGMETRTVTYGGRARIDVTMTPSVNELDAVEVFHTGYQTLSMREKTSSITSIKAEDILDRGLTSIDQMLEGHVAGMTFIQNSGQLGSTPKLRIRGTTTILGSREPIWVVDGFIWEDPVNISASELNDLDFVNLIGNAISGINPEDIDQIDILKDASATALYGKRAANGVIVITTKKGKIGPPTISYSASAVFTQRPRYTDRAVNMMNSQERMAFSRELIESHQPYPTISSWVGYEALYRDYLKGNIGFDEYQQQANYYETLNTDWFDVLMQDALSHKHTVSVSGGNSETRYRLSVGANNSNGVIKGEKLTNYTASTSISTRFKKLDIQFDMYANISEKEYTPSSINVVEYAYNTNRSIPVYTEDGNYWYYDRKPWITSDLGTEIGTGVFPFNIVEDMNNSWREMTGNGLSANLKLNYEILPVLKFELSGFYSFSNSLDQTYYGQETLRGRSLNKSYNASSISRWYATSLMPEGGELTESRSNRKSYTVRAMLSYDQYFGADNRHRITGLFGSEVSSSEYFNLTQTYRGYYPDRGLAVINPYFPNEINFNEDTFFFAYTDWLYNNDKAKGVRTRTLDNQVSMFLVAAYGYKEHFILNFNARVDYANEFASRSTEKFFPVWSVSGRWNLSENILKNVTWIDDLALNASYGLQGNVPKAPVKVVIEQSTKKTSAGEFFSTISKYPNSNLKWETTAMTNIGIDFSLFKRFISGTIEIYNRYSRDVFVIEKISEVNGVNSLQVNKGTLSNTGVDITLNFMPINRMNIINGEYKGFRWQCDPNLGQIVNQILKKTTGSAESVLMDDNSITYSAFLNGSIPVTGDPVDGFYSYKFIGLDPNDGRPMFQGKLAGYTQSGEPIYWGFEQFYYEENGDVINLADMYAEILTNEERLQGVMFYSGSRTPTIQGGITNTFSYNNFTLGIQMSYSLGSKIRLTSLYTNVASQNGTIAPQPVENARRELLDRWRMPGDENTTTIPGIVPVSVFVETMSPWWTSESGMKAYNLLSSNIWQMYDYSDVRVVSGDYLRIQSVSFRYRFPIKICEKIGMKSAYVNFSASNIYTFCSSKLNGQDPATQTNSESLSLSYRPTYTLTLNLTF